VKNTLPEAFVVWLFLCGSTFAQQTTGSIAGRVLDQQGAIVPGATVTARNPQTGFVRTVPSDGEGLYRLVALPVGTYDVQAELEGFTTMARKDVDVNVAQTQTVDFKLRVAGLTQTVTVIAPARFGETTASSVGQVVDLRLVQSLPLNGRQFANLAATVPGVGLGFFLDPTKGTNYAPFINGGAGRNINYVIDGGDNNDDTVGGLLQQFPLEGIQEFNFRTARFTAEDGRSDGGVLNVVTKSGTNRFQGSVFELFRDKAMNALTETEKLAGAAANTAPVKGDYDRNQFGGSFGGPLVVDKLHFFFAIERTAQDTTQTVNTQGLFPGLDGVYPTLYLENLDDVKLTWSVNQAQYVAIRYGWNNNSFPSGASPATTPNNWGDATNTFSSINLNHNWVLNGTKLNEFIFQYSGYDDAITARSLSPELSFPNGVATGGNLNTPQATEQQKYQVRDDFSWHVSGHGGLGHDFKIGGTFLDEPRLFINSAGGSGVVAYTMLTNSPTGPVQSVSENGGNGSVNIPTKQYGLYIQDEWRAADRLTLNLGVRYDLVTGLDFDQSLNPNFVKVQAAARAGLFNTLPSSIAAVLNDFALSEQSDRNDIEPRIGAVYAMKGNGKDIVRGGWGIYSDFGYTNSNVLLAALDATGNRFGTVFAASDPTGLKNPDGSLYQVGQPLGNLTSQNQVAPGSQPLLGFWADPRLKEPRQLQANVGWSHELSSNTIVNVDYVNSLGRDLNYKPRLNQLIPGTTIRQISALLSSPLNPNNSADRPVLSNGQSQYNGLTVSARRRLSKGVDLSASYTLSRSLSTIGNASDELNTANIQNPSNPFNNPAQMGPDVLTDARHRVNLSAIAQLPFGVQVAPFFLYRSALPIYIIDGRDLNQTGDITEIPAEAFAVASTNAATGKATLQAIGPCTTVNCGRGWPQSQLNLRVSRAFRVGHANVEAIGEVFNVFNAINPSNIVAGTSVNRSEFLASGAPNPSFLQPVSFSGDAQRPEQRIGQIGLRLSF